MRTILIAIAVLTSHVCTACPLVNAIKAVENAPNGERGDNGRARGPLQIHRDYWQDAMEFLGYDWPYEYADVEWRAVLAFDAYCARYGAVTWEDRARLHNGGPSRSGTDDYWARVSAIIEFLREDAPTTADLLVADWLNRK